jgi:hypothetical protein
MRRLAHLFAIFLLSQTATPQDQRPTEEYLRSLAETAVELDNPAQYLTQNGFECTWWQECASREEGYGCNIWMSEGRMFFIQLRNKAGTWIVDRSHSYDPYE